MEKVTIIIQKIQEDKSNFDILIEKMKPLINKYTKLLYKDEKEDVKSEMILALWEAVIKMEYHDDEGKCMMFLCTELKNRFLELYRKSKKYYDNYTVAEYDYIDRNELVLENYCDIILFNDLNRVLEQYDEKKRVIYKEIIFDQKSDSEIAHKYHISRQYANRLRRIIYKKLKTEYFQC